MMKQNRNEVLIFKHRHDVFTAPRCYIKYGIQNNEQFKVCVRMCALLSLQSSFPAALCAYGRSADPETVSGVGGCSHRRKKHIWPLQCFEPPESLCMCVCVCVCLGVDDNRSGNWTETEDHYDTLNLLICTVADSSSYTLDANGASTAKYIEVQ